MPCLFDASARQRRMFPSSEPERTYWASGVNLAEKTLEVRLVVISSCLVRHGGKHIPLHSLCVINVPRVATGSVPESDCSIVRCSHQLLPCRAKLHIHNRSHMILQHIHGSIHLPHVKNV